MELRNDVGPKSPVATTCNLHSSWGSTCSATDLVVGNRSNLQCPTCAVAWPRACCARSCPLCKRRSARLPCARPYLLRIGVVANNNIHILNDINGCGRVRAVKGARVGCKEKRVPRGKRGNIGVIWLRPKATPQLIRRTPRGAPWLWVLEAPFPSGDAADAMEHRPLSGQLPPGAEDAELPDLSWRDVYSQVGTGVEWMVPQGLAAGIYKALGPVPVQLNTKVEKIHWGDGDTRVETSQGTLRCQAVIVTVPTEIIADGSIAFEPALPSWKMKAFQGVPMGVLDKIALQFNDDFSDFMEETDSLGQPFFIWYAPFLPHTPHNPPKALEEKYLKVAPSPSVAKYWAMVEWFDQTTGELLNHLKEKGWEDNTIIVYTCDNGWIQSIDARGYAPRSKRSPFEGGIRTPVMFKYPGVISPKMNTESVVSNVDMVPTVLSLLGLEKGELPGIDVLDEAALANRSVVFAEAYDHDIRNIDVPTETILYKIAIEKDWKLLLPNTEMVKVDATTRKEERAGFYSKDIQLFNLAQDPGELTNVAAEFPDQVERLKQSINNWWQPKD